LHAFHTKTLLLSAILSLSAPAAAQTTGDAPKSPVPAKATEPEKSTTPAKTEIPLEKAPEKKSAATPAAPTTIVDPATLPAPTLLLDFNDARVENAVKLVEHGDFEAALKIIVDALKEETARRNDSAKQELNLGKAVVLMRSGKIAEARTALGACLGLKDSQPDRGVRTPDSVPRRAQFLEVVASVLPKVIKGETPPASKPDVWRVAITNAAAKVQEKHEKAVKEFDRNVKADRWGGVTQQLEQLRQLVEQLDCAQGAASDHWTFVAKAHAETIENAVRALNTRANELQSDISRIRPTLRESGKAPGWYPIAAVNRYNYCVDGLKVGKAAAEKLSTHYGNARSKWGGAFGRQPGVGHGFDLIPEERRAALVH